MRASDELFGRFWPPYPYGLCEADADLYGQDADPDEMAHRECAGRARHLDDQLFARAQELNRQAR